ncbi:murein hydrolase activator EnvC family protein [Krasilnikoviella flava]|uniref:Peptidase family M23 n=1 Tax=Krasilnikoviella flava TaxID=526729 RepID=A0A1T5LS86_9MICO|nr:M23 family metallopeptidase [Krasilnikoviella flava]SKC78725.1 Peptidase family M23 [Krasilnikoviella flava]
MDLPETTLRPTPDVRTTVVRAGGPPRGLLAAGLVLAALLAGLAGTGSAAAADDDVAPPVATAGPAMDGWQRPVTGAVAHAFDPPAEEWGAGHRGVDLAARTGEPVRSPAPGVVSFAGQVADKPVVVVTHADGLRSTFEPVSPAVRLGDAVGAGDVVGTLAAVPGHCAPAGCLHWGVLRGDVYLDPLALVGEATPIVLLPGGP